MVTKERHLSSFRTDNAVKNRFTTLCKKRAKQEAFAKENSSTTTSFINLNNKRVIFPNGLIADGGSETSAPYKKLRYCQCRLILIIFGTVTFDCTHEGFCCDIGRISKKIATKMLVKELLLITYSDLHLLCYLKTYILPK